MFGSSKSDGAASTPATAPSAAASPQPSGEHRATCTPASRASTGLTAAARRPSPIFVRVKSSPIKPTRDERDADHAEVLLRERDAADVDRRGRERPVELARSRRPRSRS